MQDKYGTCGDLATTAPQKDQRLAIVLHEDGIQLIETMRSVGRMGERFRINSYHRRASEPLALASCACLSDRLNFREALGEYPCRTRSGGNSAKTMSLPTATVIDQLAHEAAPTDARGCRIVAIVAPSAHPPLPWQLPPAAERLVDTFRRTGSLELETSRKAIAGILACTMPFLAMIGYSFTSPNPTMPIAVGAVFAGPLLGVAIWITWLLFPRVRVVVDSEGLVVRGKRVTWAEISEFRIGIARSRATYTFVIAERTGTDGHPMSPTNLPLLLSPDAAKLKAALDVLLAQRHDTARGIPGRIQRWPRQP